LTKPAVDERYERLQLRRSDQKLRIDNIDPPDDLSPDEILPIRRPHPNEWYMQQCEQLGKSGKVWLNFDIIYPQFATFRLLNVSQCCNDE